MSVFHMNPFIRMLLDQFARGWLERKGPPAFRGPTPERRKRGNKIPYGRGLQNHFNRKRRDAMEAADAQLGDYALRDQYGAYRLIGKARTVESVEDGVPTITYHPRRVWRAGLSQQRATYKVGDHTLQAN